MIKTTKQFMPVNAVTENLPVALALKAKQEQVLDLSYVAPCRRVEAIIALEKARVAFIRAENNAIRSMSQIEDDLLYPG